MNTIEQMYKEYGVRERAQCLNKYAPENDCCDCPCDECSYYEMQLPPFTAEKQIELIKLLINYDGFVEIHRLYESDEWAVNASDILGAIMVTFEEALAEIVIKLKPHIDNSKVKEILEG